MKHFTISELLKSDTAIKNRIWNGCNRECEDNLIALVAAVLDPLREKYGKAIHVSSGYRCPAVNKAIGGSLTSQHMQGEAADIWVDAGAKGNFEIGKLIVQLGNFDQVIFENVGANDLLPQWIHVSWKRQGYNRHQIRKKLKGSNNYPLLTPKDLGL